MLNRRTFLTVAAATPLATLLTGPAMAAEPEVFAIDGIAIRGADPVAYFTQGAPVIGTSTHAVVWRGAQWQFADMQNMETFLADPERFAPQYGGYCAFALSKGAIATSVPDAWTVHNGKLYLNFSLNVRQVWTEDIPGNIVLADAQWPAILG